MKTNKFFALVIFLLVLTACSTTSAPTYAPIATFASILPVAQSTPAIEPGSGAAQAYSVVEAYQDGFSVGRNWYVNLNRGEKAFLDQEDKILQINDAQGRVMLENLGNDYIRFYAWEGGYNINVGAGFVLLMAGHSYTQRPLSADWDREVVEVRQMSDDQQVGYILLLRNFTSDGAFTGYETPIAFIDANADGIVSLTELDTSLSQLCQKVLVLGRSKPVAADGFVAEINAAYAMINSGAITNAYLKIKQIESEINTQ
ncbi:MAG: hypothetical protein ABIJ65_13400 [Chloroflexota bacterium]